MLLEEIFRIYFYPAIHAILITAAVTAIVFTGLLLIEKSFTRIARKMFQNLDLYVVKIIATIWILSYLIISYFFNEHVNTIHLFGMCVGTMILIAKHKVDALDDEMQDAINHDKSWWDALWGDSEKVDGKYLNKETYEKLVAKIKAEYETKGIRMEAIKRLSSDLTQTLEIIDNINEIFRKALKGETTMLINKELLFQSYQELKERYGYFDQKYQEVLQDNYALKNKIADSVARNEQRMSNTELFHTL